ncbi:MAG: chitobiase/beta-hexosaminidase C-terminal domain-containing protein, partial [Bacteroidales bacterium]|nr:chitobiase/beta-hexosaminidase C-terminal domain-containing protein [Bacteroidales bacterium]
VSLYAVYGKSPQNTEQSLTYGWEDSEPYASQFTTSFLNTNTSIAAKSGDKYGANVNEAGNGVGGGTCDITTKNKLSVNEVNFYYSKTSTNTTEQNWVLQTSVNGQTWTTISPAYSATSMQKGEWLYASWTLDGSPVYVKVTMSSTTSTAIRAIDDLTIIYGSESVIYNTNPNCGQTIAMPSFNPPSGNYCEPQTITISCTTPGAVIYYTTDGSEPTNQSSVYSEPIYLISSATIKAFAEKDGVASDVATADYFIGGTCMQQGDLAIIAVNTHIDGTSGDEITFVSFVDIEPDTEIFFTDNGYEVIYEGYWGTSEGIFSIIRTGTTLPKGTPVTIRTNGDVASDANVEIYDNASTVSDKWTVRVEKPRFNLNYQDQIWITQGGMWSNEGDDKGTYNGNVLYGFTGKGWRTAPNWSNFGQITSDENKKTHGSTLYPHSDCFTTDVNLSGTNCKGIYIGDMSETSRYAWVGRINNSDNWWKETEGDNMNNENFNNHANRYFTHPTQFNISDALLEVVTWEGNK